MALFDLKIPEPTNTDRQSNTLKEKSAAKVLKLIESHTRKVAIVNQHIPDIPGPNEAVFVWTTNQFNTVSFLLWLIEHRTIIEDLTISTYSIGANCINSLIRLVDSGQILKAHIYISTYMQSVNAKCVDLLRSQAAARPQVSIGYGFNHSKVLLAKTGNDHVVITGSGNFAENARNEQYTICNDERIYKFYYDCIREDSSESGR